MTLDDITIIITTYKSNKKVKLCLDSIQGKCKVIIIENSKDQKLKESVEKNYKNVECIIPFENLGYGKANNLALKKVTTKYSLILNPDTNLSNNALEKFLIRVNNNLDFAIIGPQDFQNIKNEKNLNLIKVNNLKGFAMFLNMYKFKNIGFFDENFFLYFEEIDLCKKIKINNENIYLDSNIKIFHEGGKSVDASHDAEIELNRNWHWMWSTFYFHKKYKGLVFALIITFPYLISSFFRVIFYLLTFNEKKKNIYKQRLGGLVNSILGKKSWYRPKI